MMTPLHRLHFMITPPWANSPLLLFRFVMVGHGEHKQDLCHELLRQGIIIIPSSWLFAAYKVSRNQEGICPAQRDKIPLYRTVSSQTGRPWNEGDFVYSYGVVDTLYCFRSK